MCGRFNVTSTPGLEQLLRSLGHSLESSSRCNIAPTEPVPLLADGKLVDARWWLTPRWAKAVDQKYAMFNARCEGLAKSPAFRTPFASQRGIVPMSSFIEWRRSAGPDGGLAQKQPWLIRTDSEALAVAALWDVWCGDGETLLSCTLVTTEAAPEFRPWHDRMPVLLDASERERWLDNGCRIAIDDPLFSPRLKEPLSLSPLNPAVGNSRHKDPALLAPAGETVRLLPGDGGV